MKRRPMAFVLLGAAVVLSAASCAGGAKPAKPVPEEPAAQVPAEPTPQVVAPAPETPPDPSKMEPDQASIDALKAARARAEKSRKQAFDLESPSYFPDDWKSAETLFLDARTAAGERNLAAYRAAAAGYGAAADAYDAVARKALPLYAEARRSEVEAARNRAVAAGVPQMDPDRFAAADAVSERAIGLYGREDYYAAADAAAEAGARYEALKIGADAVAVKSEIDRRNFARFDSGNYALAGTKLGQAMASYDGGDIPAARSAVDESLQRYNLALGKGRELNAGERSSAAGERRRAALDLKANVAVRSDFDAAAAVMTRADTAFKAGRFDEAADLYGDAESQFAAVRDVAAEKRRIAEEAMERARRRIAETEQAAKEADSILQGGTR